MYCRKCGIELKDEWKVCPSCGNVIDGKPSVHSSSGIGNKMKYKKQVLIITFVLLAVMIFIGAVVMYPQVQRYREVQINQAEADKVIAKISSLVNNRITTESEAEIDEINKEYNALTDSQKKLVTNLEKLENAYEVLEVRKDEQAAQTIIEDIEEVDPDKLTDTDTTIQAIEEQFEALTEKQKQLVTNRSKLDEYIEVVKKKKHKKEVEKQEAEKKAIEEATQKAEKQAAIDDAYNFVVDKKFHMINSQGSIEFTSSGEFVAYGYYGTSPMTNKYCVYKFSAEYLLHKDVMQYLVFVEIEGVQYYFRYFANGQICLQGEGEFDAWYEPI